MGYGGWCCHHQDGSTLRLPVSLNGCQRNLTGADDRDDRERAAASAGPAAAYHRPVRLFFARLPRNQQSVQSLPQELYNLPRWPPAERSRPADRFPQKPAAKACPRNSRPPAEPRPSGRTGHSPHDENLPSPPDRNDRQKHSSRAGPRPILLNSRRSPVIRLQTFHERVTLNPERSLATSGNRPISQEDRR